MLTDESFIIRDQAKQLAELKQKMVTLEKSIKKEIEKNKQLKAKLRELRNGHGLCRESLTTRVTPKAGEVVTKMLPTPSDYK